MSKTKIKVRQTASLTDQVMKRVARIRERAFQLFESRDGAGSDLALDDWLMAEHELALRPWVELAATEDGYQFEAGLPGMDAEDVVVEATNDAVLITAERKTHHHGKHEGHGESSVRMFRVVHFPEAIDPEHVKADYREGLLHVRAARAKADARRPLAVSA